MARLDGRTAVVTGAAGTLGLAVARTLLEDGARVALVDLDALRLDSLVRFVRGATLVLACDVRDAAAVRRSCAEVEQKLGPVDILVNQANVRAPERAEALTEEAVRRSLATNVEGALNWCRAAIPGMKQRTWGRIVNVGCLATPADAQPGGAGLAAARGALEHATRALACEVAGHGITVNALAPAAVATATYEALNESQRRQLLARVPAGRACEPQELAHAVRFLVAPEAGFVTGQLIRLDGGLHLA